MNIDYLVLVKMKLQVFVGETGQACSHYTMFVAFVIERWKLELKMFKICYNLI